MMTDEINVIYQFNEKYVPYAGVSMTSLLANNTDARSICIYVLGEGLSQESVDKLRNLADSYKRRIVFPDTKELLGRFSDLGMIPYRGAYSVYLRMFFSELIDPGVKRALYLDSDTIVAQSLLPLVNCDLAGKSIGMVLESIRDGYSEMIGMGKGSDYFNSGMLLFDVDRWKEEKYCERLVDHIKNVRSSYIGDQDFLNIVCEGDIYRLPMKYNFQPLHARYTAGQYFATFGKEGYYSEAEINDAVSAAVVYHCYRWLGAFPWNRDSLHPFAPLFDKYLDMSPWKGYKKEDSKVGFAISVERILYRIMPKGIFIRIFKLFHGMMLHRAEKDARNQKENKSA